MIRVRYQEVKRITSRAYGFVNYVFERESLGRETDVYNNPKEEIEEQRTRSVYIISVTSNPLNFYFMKGGQAYFTFCNESLHNIIALTHIGTLRHSTRKQT